MLLTPLATVNEKHVGAFRAADRNTIEVFLYIIAGIINISGNDFAELIQPLISFRLIGADQRMHGKHVHAVVVAQAGLLIYAITDMLVIDDVIASDQSGKVKGLTRCIECNGTHLCIF